MTEPNLADIVVDPLNEVTRKERRNLLAASTAALVVSAMGLVPTKLAALGIEFAPPAQKSFLVIFAFVVGYFIIAFLVYGVADFFLWRKKFQDHLINREVTSLTWSQDDEREHDEIHENIPSADWLYRMPSGLMVYVMLTRALVFWRESNAWRWEILEMLNQWGKEFLKCESSMAPVTGCITRNRGAN